MITSAMICSLCGKENKLLGLKTFRLSVFVFNAPRGPICASSTARKFVSYHKRKTELESSRFGVSTHISRTTDSYFYQHNISKIYKNFDHGFRTSTSNNVHPILLALIKPMARLLPMVLGRKFRRWWKGLSDSDKNEIKDAKKGYISILGGDL